MNPEIKLVVDASKALRSIRAVELALGVVQAATLLNTSLKGTPFNNTDHHVDLQYALNMFKEAGAFEPFSRPLAIVGAETQVGQFVTASPAYGVYAGDTGQYVPNNFTTHRSSWRKAIENEIERAKQRCFSTTGRDDLAYWQHELAAFDRSFNRLLGGERIDPAKVKGGAPVFRKGQEPEQPVDSAWDGFLKARKTVIFEFFNEGKSYAQIAYALGLSDALQVELIHTHPMNQPSYAPPEQPRNDAYPGLLPTWSALGDPYLKMVADLIDMPYSPADPVGAERRASELMDDGRRFRVLLKASDLHEKLTGDEPADLTKNEQEVLTRISDMPIGSTHAQTRAVIDGIIGDKLLDEEDE